MKNSGWLVTIMKTRRQKDKVKPIGDDLMDEVLQLVDQYSIDEAIQDIEYLKTTKFDSNTAEIIHEKLKLTVSARQKMLKDESANILEHFPYFFTNPELVKLFTIFVNVNFCMVFIHIHITFLDSIGLRIHSSKQKFECIRR